MGFVRAGDRVEVDEDQFGEAQPESPGQLTDDDLGDQRLVALGGPRELHDVGPQVVGLDESRQ